MLLCAVATFAQAVEVTTGLPGTTFNQSGHDQYEWTSEKMTAPAGVTTLRITFLETTTPTGVDKTGQYPHVAIAEFYLYDKDGNIITLTADKFSSNATEPNEGGIAKLCDGTVTGNIGAYDWYWHTMWSGSPNPDGYHYLEVDLRGVAADLSEYTFGWKTRQHNGSPTKVSVETEANTFVDVTYNFTYGGEIKMTQVIKDVVVGEDFPEFELPFGVTGTKPTGTVSTENATQEIALSISLPFTVSTLEQDGSFGEGMHWYTLTLRGADLTYNAASNKSVAADVAAKSPANFYAFTGNPFDGYKLFNYAAGPSKIVWSEKVDDSGTAIPFTELTSVTENTDWLLFANNDGYTLRREDNEYGYINGRNGALSYWISSWAATDDGSRLTIDEVTDDVLAEFIETYKTTTIATLDEWANLSVVFDAELIATAKAAVSAVEANGIATFATIDSKLTDVTDAVAAKMFTFQTTATDTGRNGVWVSASTSAGKAIGADTQDYNAIWSLRHAGGTSFYMYNELTSKYMGNPGGECSLTVAPVDSYSFEIVDAEKNIVEMKSGGGTLHASNWNSNALINWDGNEAASRWYIRTIDVAADIQTILDGLTAEDYAETPALGQYSKAAYDALVAARTNAKTVAEVEAAIAAFNKGKNKPVYFIRSAHTGYAAGSAIYYDGAWKWKAANKYDRQMWMTIPEYKEENVPVVNAYNAEGTSYEICDYLTGTVMRGKSVQIVAIDSWDNAYNLQYGTAVNDAAQHAASGGSVVNWNPATTDGNQASAWYIDYLGTSYELDQLTDDKIAALSALQTAYNAKAFYADAVIGDGLGEYTGDKDAIVAALATAESFAAKTLVEQATLSMDEITAATDALNNAALVINLPVDGKYYRIKGACEDQLPGYYLSGNENPDGGRIACQKDADAATIFYYKDGKLLAYNTGLYLALNKDNWKFSSVDGKTPASTVTFAGSPRIAGAYTVLSDDRYLHYTSTDYFGDLTVQVDRCSVDADAKHDWALEEVESLPVTVTAAGYATLYAPVALTVPTGVTAHTVTLDGEWAVLSDALATIPANTGVVLVGTGSFDFAIAADVAEVESALEGTVAATYVTDDAYVLGIVDEKVGFYTATKNQNEGAAFLNNANKAYLPKTTGMNAASYSFRFQGGATGIDEITDNRVQSTVIYDLTGRRVENITAPGIYIVNGKKVLVK